ncbi:hypothetical protein PMSD_10005 [Paenibacillus macquariensis subsp. defensor]|nr:hypothetical protein PMSD_10005 [Paenibacillus macquariensis subsp. defensor]
MIKEIAWEIFELRKENYLTKTAEEISKLETSFSLLMNKFEDGLKVVNEKSELLEVIKRDKDSFDFPITLMIDTYKKLIELDPICWEHYEDFIDYLSWFGPDWEHEQKEMERYIKTKDWQNAKTVVNIIEYDKDFE